MDNSNINKGMKTDFRDQPLYGFYRGVVLENRDRSIEQKNKIYGRVLVHIPALFEDPEVGVWACPGNNPIGGRNNKTLAPNKDRNGGKQEFCGSSFIPPINSWLWIFFEGGDPNRPFYGGGLDIMASELPPELCVQKSSKPEERWLVFRSPKGRVIMISDDPENCRVEITGFKRSNAAASEDHAYKIMGNQKTIIIDDKAGQEKIMIQDEKGNYINIRTSLDDIDVHCKNIIRIFADKEIYLNAPHIGMRGHNSIYIDSPDLQTNKWTNRSLPDTPPNGERDE